MPFEFSILLTQLVLMVFACVFFAYAIRLRKDLRVWLASFLFYTIGGIFGVIGAAGKAGLISESYKMFSMVGVVFYIVCFIALSIAALKDYRRVFKEDVVKPSVLSPPHLS